MASRFFPNQITPKQLASMGNLPELAVAEQEMGEVDVVGAGVGEQVVGGRLVGAHRPSGGG